MSLRLDKHLLSLLFFMFFYLIFHYIWLFIWYDNPKVNHIGLDINSIIGDFAAFLSLYVTYKKGTEEKNRFWLLLALGCLSFLIGDIFWMYEHTILGLANTAISISDCFFLLFTLFYLIAFAYKITQDYNLLQKLFILCDICTTMTAAVTLEYHFFVKNILSIGDMSWFEVYIRVMYPTLNVLLLLMAVSLYFQPLTFASKKVLYILILAIILYVFVDHLYDYLAAEHNKLSIIVIDPLYPAAMLLTAMAGVLNYSTCTSAQIKEQRFSEETNNKIQLSLSYIGAIALVIFAIFSKNLSYEHIIGLSVAFSFVLFREALVRHQNKELMAQMAQFNQELSTRIESRTYDLIHQTEALLQSEQKFKSLYEYHPDPIFTIDLQGRFLQVNKAGTILLGYQASELLGRFYMDLIYESDLDKLQAAFQSVQHRDSVSLEVRAYHKNQEVYHLNVTIVPIIKKDELAGMYIMVKDITEVKRQQKQINYLAYHDTLTGLSNRHCFRNDLKRAIDNAKRTKNTFAVLFVDLDRFKAINDTLGHGIGDLVLIEIANRLRTCIPPSAKLARLGGDEFTILTGHFQDIQIPKMIAQEILTAIQKPLQVEGHTLRVTPSIGIAIYPDAGEDLHSLLKHADMAMYTIKNNGKNNFSIYNEKMSQNMRRKLRLEQDLFNAIENKEIFLQYQPQIDIAANQVIGVEALVRWNHPQYGIISPCEFIPIAEETGLIAAIGEWVLREACSQMKAWKIGGFPELKVAVNLSAAQFKKESFVQTITTILRETGLDPCSLDLELTERIAMNNEAKTMQKLKALKELGIHISIDDFGTGYSSLAYLPLYPIDSLKIAREFINMAENCTEGKAIISTILSLAKTLNISVIAEGVETAEQLQFLKSYGCHRVQGYLFSKPLDKDACLRFLEEFSSISC